MPELSRLKELQQLPLERKVGFTAARIAEFYKAMDGKVCVSFSGGKDSTVLLYLVRSLFPDVKAVFADTGLEYPEIRDFVKTFDNVDWVKPSIPFNKVIEKYGYPVISKDCAQRIHEYHNDPNTIAACYLGLERHLLQADQDKLFELGVSCGCPIQSVAQVLLRNEEKAVA